MGLLTIGDFVHWGVYLWGFCLWCFCLGGFCQIQHPLKLTILYFVFWTPPLHISGFLRPYPLPWFSLKKKSGNFRHVIRHKIDLLYPNLALTQNVRLLAILMLKTNILNTCVCMCVSFCVCYVCVFLSIYYIFA